MLTKTYLGQMKNIDRRIRDKVIDSQRWLDIAISKSIGSASSEGERVQSSPNPDRICNAIVKSVDYGRQAEEEADRLTEIMHTITKQIDGLDDETYYNILRGYYIDGKSLTTIAYEIGYNTKYIYNKYDEALDSFESLYGQYYLTK